MQLDELVRKLHNARATEAAHTFVVGRLTEAFKAVHKEEFDALDAAKAATAEAEAELRAAMSKAYEENKQREFFPGVLNKVGTKFEYSNADAIAWCKTNMPLAVTTVEQLDAKLFGAVCKEDKTRPDFVTVKEVATPNIAKDLSKAVEALPVAEATEAA